MRSLGRSSDTDGGPFTTLVLALFLLVALLAGGATSNTLADAVTQVCAIPILCLGLWRLWFGGEKVRLGWALALVCGAVAVPIVQLIPLPPALWTALPGREIVAEGFRSAGITLPSLPISLTPHTTYDTAMALLPPIAMFLAAAQASEHQRRILAGVVLACTLTSIGLALLQKLGGPDSPLWLYPATRDAPIGLFSNRNHQAAFLATSLAFAAVPATHFGAKSPERDLAGWLVLAAYALVIGVSAVVTTSRAGVFLTVVGMFGAALIAWKARAYAGAGRRLIVTGLGGGAFAMATLAAALSYAPLAQRLGGGFGDELRWKLFPMAATAGLDFAPIGSGIGSFSSIYLMYETPQELLPSFINYAHNDFLQIWVEGGVFGVILIAAFLAWWTLNLRQALAAAGPSSAMRLAGAIVVWQLLVHTMVDYPLRTTSLSVVFALACAMMSPAYGVYFGAKSKA